MSWCLDDRAMLISMEKTDEVYGRLMREFGELRSRYAASTAELKRVGKNFVAFGNDLCDRPLLMSTDWPTFEKETSGIRALLQEHQDLTYKLRDKKLELEQFGPLPKFD